MHTCVHCLCRREASNLEWVSPYCAIIPSSQHRQTYATS
jgi:hypothetical protein